MTINVGTISQSTDSFGQWLTKTNLVINALAQYTVTTNSNTAAGNAAITGTFYSNSYYTSNAGSLFLSTNTTSNAVVNSNLLIFNSGPTSNSIITSSGMLIDGSTAYTKTLISMGNTVIRTANVSSNSGYFTDQLFVGNTFFYKNNVLINSANIVSANFAANLVVGAADGNTIIDRTGVYISYNDNLPAGDTNSYFTAYELKVGTVKTANLSISGSNSLFTANVLFAGANNFFINGLGSTGDVDIVGSGKHFSHGYYSNIISSNITFVYNGGGGGSNFTRNVFQSITGQNIYANSSAEILNLNNGYLTATVIPNATPGTSSSTGSTTILSANTTKAYFANALGVGGITTPLDALHIEGAIRLESAAGTGYVRLLAPPTNVNFDLILPEKKGKIKQVLVVVDETNGILGFDDNHGSDKDDVDVEARSIGVGVNAPGGGSGAGEIRAKGNVIAYYSDERLKDVLGPIENALGKVLSLDGFYYKANETAKELGYTDETHVGISAQKVQAILPEAVFPAPVDEKYLTVQYDKLVPLLIEAIKELKAEIDSLKNGNKN